MAVNLKALSTFDTISAANEGAWLTLLDAAGNPSELRVRVLGTDSDRWRKAGHDDTNLRIRAAQNAGKTFILSSEQIEEIGLRRLAKVTIEWSGFPDENGAAAECNAENVYAVYKSFPQIARQVDEFVNNPANFGKEGEKSASVFNAEEYMAQIAKN